MSSCDVRAKTLLMSTESPYTNWFVHGRVNLTMHHVLNDVEPNRQRRFEDEYW
jgi:hypothetical protein